MRSILEYDICLHGEQICQIEKNKMIFKTLTINENGWQKKTKRHLTFRLRQENAIINTWLGQLKMSTKLYSTYVTANTAICSHSFRRIDVFILLSCLWW